MNFLNWKRARTEMDRIDRAGIFRGRGRGHEVDSIVAKLRIMPGTGILAWVSRWILARIAGGLNWIELD